MELDPYDKLKQSILKLGESHQQVVPYQSTFSHQQQPMYSYGPPPLNVYGSNYSMPRIGFENFIPQQPSNFRGYQQMAIQRYGLNNPSSVSSYSSPSTSSFIAVKSNEKHNDSLIKEIPKKNLQLQQQKQNIFGTHIVNQKSDNMDLINLDVSDEATSFANILQTFDPLISKQSTINEEASNSYYSDQDPFDYIYSGNSYCSGMHGLLIILELFY